MQNLTIEQKIRAEISRALSVPWRKRFSIGDGRLLGAIRSATKLCLNC